jgi:hypothetical protein
MLRDLVIIFFSVYLLLAAALCPCDSAPNRNEYKGIVPRVNFERPVKLTTSSSSENRLSRKCWIPDVSYPCGLPRLVTGIAFCFQNIKKLEIYCWCRLFGCDTVWFLSHLWWRQYVPRKRWFLQEPHIVASQKTTFFIVTALALSNLT